MIQRTRYLSPVSPSGRPVHILPVAEECPLLLKRPHYCYLSFSGTLKRQLQMPRIHIERSLSFFYFLNLNNQFTDVEPVADLDSAQTLIVPLLLSNDFGTSTTIAITFVPANVSLPGLLKELAEPDITF